MPAGAPPYRLKVPPSPTSLGPPNAAVIPTISDGRSDGAGLTPRIRLSASPLLPKPISGALTMQHHREERPFPHHELLCAAVLRTSKSGITLSCSDANISGCSQDPVWQRSVLSPIFRNIPERDYTFRYLQPAPRSSLWLHRVTLPNTVAGLPRFPAVSTTRCANAAVPMPAGSCSRMPAAFISASFSSLHDVKVGQRRCTAPPDLTPDILGLP